MTQQSGRPLAVVTGASRGIGYELAVQFAQHGFDLLVVADSDLIEEAAGRLRELGTEVQSLEADLATFEGTETLYSTIQSSGRPVDAVAMNAGIGVGGPFGKRALEEHLNLIQLNVVSPVHLTHRLIRDMAERGQGRILYTASVASTMPGPFDAAYNGSKAFLKSFAEAIRNELKDTGVTVTVLMPGATETNFFHRAGMEDTKLGQSEKDDPADVAREGFEALMKGEDHVVAGSFKNKLESVAGHILPDTVMAGMHRKQTEPGSGEK